jgi:FixJ family two-component response regulator
MIDQAQGQLVYIIDDDEAVRDSMGMLLDSADLQFACFETADDFLGHYDGSQRGCLVLDIRMPGMSGLELQRKLIDLNSALPVIFITGHGDVPMAVEAMRRGAIDFLRKPVRESDLLTRIEQAYNRSRALVTKPGTATKTARNSTHLPNANGKSSCWSLKARPTR